METNANEIMIYSNDEFGEIRTTETENGQILFCGMDIAKALGYSNPRKAIADHCKEKGVTKRDTLTKGGLQKLTYIDEGNVYRLIVHSKLPNVENFELWIFNEVIPAMRKTGRNTAESTALSRHDSQENVNEVMINNIPVGIKEYQGQRVITLKDIDVVHNRPEGTARKRFNDNKKYFIEGEDYFKVCVSEIRTHKIMEISAKANEDVTFITESGYLMLVKSFTDDLAWNVQRQLVKGYFRARALDSYQIADPIERAKRWIEEQEEKKALALQLEEQKETIQEQAGQIQELSPKAEYCDAVLNADGLVSATEMAKSYGKTAIWLNKKLHELGIQYKHGKTWYLYQRYAQEGYTVTKTVPIKNKSGKTQNFVNMYWTAKGRQFIYEVLKSQGILPLTTTNLLIEQPERKETVYA